MERIAWTRTNKMKKISGGMVKTRSQKSWEDQKAMLEVEIHPKPALDENWAGRGTEGKGMGTRRRLTSESTPVEQGHHQQGDWLFGSVWCGQDNKQDCRWKTAVKRVYDQDKLAGATRKEQDQRVKYPTSETGGGL